MLVVRGEYSRRKMCKIAGKYCVSKFCLSFACGGR